MTIKYETHGKQDEIMTTECPNGKKSKVNSNGCRRCEMFIMTDRDKKMIICGFKK